MRSIKVRELESQRRVFYAGEERQQQREIGHTYLSYYLAKISRRIPTIKNSTVQAFIVVSYNIYYRLVWQLQGIVFKTSFGHTFQDIFHTVSIANIKERSYKNLCTNLYSSVQSSYSTFQQSFNTIIKILPIIYCRDCTVLLNQSLAQFLRQFVELNKKICLYYYETELFAISSYFIFAKEIKKISLKQGFPLRGFLPRSQTKILCLLYLSSTVHLFSA